MGIKERRVREKENRIRIILDAAKDAFMKKGFQNTSMEEIANQAEIGKGTIYIYFKNKNDLYTAILLSGLESFRKRLKDLENGLDSGVLNSTADIIMAFLKLNEKTYNENPDSILYQSYQLNQLLLKLSPENLKRLNEAGRKNLSIARGIISKAIKKKHFPEVNPVQVIDTFRAIVLGNLQLGESRTMFGHKNYIKENLYFSFSMLSKAFEALNRERHSVRKGATKKQRKQEEANYVVEPTG